jgi:hypothetical protein
MHPIEHLRYVARATGADPSLVAKEAASALRDMARMEPAGLVPACRRLIERHLTCGPIWWLSARILASDDPAAAAREAIEELESDPTDRHLVSALPDAATVLVLGWPDAAGAALRSRGDIEALVVEYGGEGEQLVRRLCDSGNDSALVPESGAGAAAAVCDLVLVEAVAAGPTGVLALPGSLGAAAVACYAQVPVWAVVAAGRVLPSRLWDSLLTRLDESGEEPWERRAELVSVSLLTEVVGPDGPTATETGLGAATCPAAPELFRAAG